MPDPVTPATPGAAAPQAPGQAPAPAAGAPPAAPATPPSGEELLRQAVSQMTAGEDPTATPAPATPPAPSPATPPPGAKLSEEWEKITRKDAELAKQQRELAAAREKMVDGEGLQREAVENPQAFLQRFGINAEDIAISYVRGDFTQPAAGAAGGGGQPPPSGVSPQQSAMEQRLASLEDANKANLEAATNRDAVAVQNRQSESRLQGIGHAATFLETNKEKYPVLAQNSKAWGASFLWESLSQKYEKEAAYYKASGTTPTFDDVVVAMEKTSQENFNAGIAQATQIPALQKCILEAAKAINIADAKSRELPNRGVSLTNQDSNVSHSNEPPQTEEERMALAIQQMSSPPAG